MEFFKSELGGKIANALFIFLIITLVFVVVKEFNLQRLIDNIEAKSYDLRHCISFLESKKPNPNLAIISVDNQSLEYLEEDYGRWPWSREIWADVVNYLETKDIEALGFDLMFIGHQKGHMDADLKLIKALDAYDNTYTSMNYVYVPNIEERRALYYKYKQGHLQLPQRLSLNVETETDETIWYPKFYKCRRIMEEIIHSNANIAFINVDRDEDGVNRNIPMFVRYMFNDKLYPYLSFKMALDNLNKTEGIDNKNLRINKNRELILGNRKIKLDKKGMVYLNWYHSDKYGLLGYESIPLKDIIISIKREKKGLEPLRNIKNLKGKTLFLGVTATSLYDIKSVSVSKRLPGVYFHPTLYNNILDNNLITKSNVKVDIFLIVFLISLVSLFVHKSHSPIVASTISIITLILYFIFSIYMLKKFFVWVPVVLPLMSAVLAFTGMYIMKYIKKSKDFEYTYKLATTDGLTNLYNHRYFQEQLVKNIELYERYKNEFSIVLIDIDFFKKFNDTYGHQAGDAVLKQVADRLKKLVRGTDIVARYGGEEMVIILTNTPIEEAYIAANKICKGIGSTPFRLSADLEVNVTISVGVGTYPMHAKTPAELIEVADKGLYFAKENGRNQVGKIEGYEPAEK